MNLWPGWMQRIVGWLVVLLGVLFSMLIVAVTGGTMVGLKDWAAIAAVLLMGFAPMLAALVAVRNPRMAARVDLCVAPLTLLLVLLLGRSFGGLIGAVEVFSGAIAIPGFFWLFAARRNWPVLVPGVHSPRKNVSRGFRVAGLFCALVLIATAGSFLLPWWAPVGDCSGRPILDEQGEPRFVDFTARLVFVGPGTFPPGRDTKWSLWSIARVEEQFSGKHSRLPRYIVLRGFFPRSAKNQFLFVEGYHSRFAITQLLPVIEPLPCGHTGRLDGALIPLRILRDGAPRDGVRLIGSVFRGRSGQGPSTPVAGAKALIKGPLGDLVALTDAQGIYDKTGLPPGHYRVTVPSPHAWAEDVDLKAGGIGEFYFYIGD
jgi:hypothetical protein